MKTIREATPSFIRILNKRKGSASDHWRIYRFCETVQTDNGLLALNLCTDELLLIQDHDFSGSGREFCPENLCDGTAVFLKEHFFFVPEDHDDAGDVDSIRRVVRAAERVYFKGYTHFTVLPTTDCNARCYYCYEHTIEKYSMDEKTALDCAQFIINNRSKKSDQIRLSWFGGEPLYNDSAIDAICRELRKAGVKFSSEMVSNGFLYDSKTVSKAVNDWNISAVQITLDGTEPVYNRIKAYQNCVGSAYRRVKENIGNLLTAGVKVIIRLNISELNIDDMDSLIHEFNDLKPLGDLTVYSSLLFEYQSGANTETRDRLLKRQKDLENRLLSMGLLSEEREDTALQVFCCMADDPKSVIIMPNGELRSCEHFPLSAPWGNVCENKTKMTARISASDGAGVTSPSQYWSEECDRKEECSACRLYPFCIRLKHCFLGNGQCKLDHEDAILKAVHREMLQRLEAGGEKI